MEENNKILIYTDNDGLTKIDVKLEEDTLWLTQAQMCELYQTSKSNVSEHIKHIFEEGELQEDSVVRKFRTTAADGKAYMTTFYNLDMIIALGYRVRSIIATRFRQWATQRLKEYITKGFTMDDERLKKLGGGGYWKELLERIRDIRATEKVFYRQVLEIYATSIDYDPRASVSQEFFKKVQNKIHYAIHGRTAAELIVERADSEKDFMGLLTFKGSQPTLAEARTAKNYLDDKELRSMGQLVSGYLDFAERQAEKEQPMTMNDWANYLDRILTSTGEQLLLDGGRVSLFFIDHVDSYRIYDKDNVEKGKFAKMFEEEYQRALQEFMPTFTDASYTRFLSDPKHAPENIHDGYFSIDKKGKSVESKNKEGENEERGFDLIMKDKERLLSQSCPVRFIFSHSALKEGWDNPNVFQICTLKDTSNEIKKRQEVGRGMRLCVNDKGERQDADVLGDHVFDTNILTVIASESYDDFAKKLQTDMAEACANRPAVVTATLFADQLAQTQDGHSIKITTEQAVEIHEELITQGYIKKGKLTQKYFDEKKADSLQFGEMENLHSFIIKQLDKVFNPDAFKPANGRNKTEAHLVKDNFNKKEWQELWRRINTRTYYNVSFETPKLIKSAIDALDKHLNVTEIRIVVESGGMESIRDREELEAGAAMSAATVKTIRVTEVIGAEVTYDLVGELVQSTGLTRRTIVEMLKGVNPATFHQFKLNPEEFIIKAGRIINDCKAISLIQHIQYEKRTGTFGADIFEEATLRGTLGKDAIESSKSLYDLVVVDSEGIEKSFAESLEAEDDVVVYSKLPGGFYINTPMGKYNPDWAVAFREDSVKHVYFVAETKGNDIEVSQLRRAEDAKIECARCHFAAISTGDVVYSVVKTYQDLYNAVTK